MACQSVRTYLASYQLTRDVADSTVDQYRFAVGGLCKWAGRELLLDELSDSLLNRWIDHRRQANDRGEWGHARVTIRNQAAAIKTLWLAAFDEGLVAARPMRVKVIKAPLPNPDTWDMDEYGRLVAACEQLDGSFSYGVERRKAMRSLLLSGYSSGIRPCDLLDLFKDVIGRDGTFVVRQKKTGDLVSCKLHADAQNAIAAMGRFEGRRLWPLSRKVLRYWFIKLTALAGLKGTPKWMRRTGATQIEIAYPGAAQAFLGHKTPGLAWRHYIDRRQIQQSKPLPPPLAG